MAEELQDIQGAGGGSGPGFLLGIVLGALTGAAAATLFAPSTGDELRHRIAEEAAPALNTGGGPADKARSVLGRVQQRFQEARTEAQEAAQDAAERTRARYEELTGQSG